MILAHQLASRARPLLAAALFLGLYAGSASAGDRALEGLSTALEQWDTSHSTNAAVVDGADGARRKVRTALATMESRDRTRRLEFQAVARKKLPPQAAERLARAQAAYEAGQGRLLGLLRQLAAPGSSSDGLDEARELIEKMEAAARLEPLSSGELKVRAPALPTALQTTTAVAPAPDEPPIGYIPPAIRERAAELGGPVEIFEWARNGVASEFYRGVMKGPVQTLREASGNDADTAGLLIALLRAKGIPARFVRGTVEIAGPLAQAVTGTSSVEQAVRVFDRAGIPNEPIMGGFGLAAVRIERVWAEAYVPYVNYRGTLLDSQGKVWLPLDPGFKRLETPRGIDVVSELGLDPIAVLNEYLAAPRTVAPREYARSAVAALLAEQRPGVPVTDVPNRRGLPVEELGLLPSSLPYKVIGSRQVSYEPPPGLTHTLRVVATTADESIVLDATSAVADVLGQRLTLSYVPFSEADQETADAFGGLLQTPPYLVAVKPVLRSGGVVLAAGTGAIGLGVKFRLDVELRAADGGAPVVVTNTVLAGNLTAIGLGGRAVTGVDEGLDEAARILSGMASRYLERWNQSDAELADLFRVVPVRPTVSVCFVQSAFEVEYAGGDPLYPISFDWKGVAVDADLRSSAPAGVSRRESETAFTLLSGLEGSILENRLFEEDLGIEAVSTAKALQLAAAQSIPVLEPSDPGEVDALPLDEAVKEELRTALARGLRVRVPTSPVTHRAWSGVGYLLLDEATGETAWQLQGGHSGGVTAPATYEWPAELLDTFSQQSESPAPEPSLVATIQKYASTDFQFGTVAKDLAKPFRVLVTDVDGYPVPNALVTFSVLGGGGVLIDPATGRPGTEELVVRSCAGGESSEPCQSLRPGEAVALLRQGERTDLIPRYTCPEGYQCECPAGETCPPEGLGNSEQVGVNLVSVRSGAATLPEPFASFARPDYQFDGTFAHIFLKFKSDRRQGWLANMSVPDWIALDVSDQHGNPLSNVIMRIAFHGPPLQMPPPPPFTAHARPATTTPGHVLKPADYQRCREQSGTVVWGQCQGEAEEAIVSSSIEGVFVYPVLGDSPHSAYLYDVGTAVTHEMYRIGWGTVGVYCNASPCHPEPIEQTVQGVRGVQTNVLGNAVEAYPPGAEATVGMWADVVYEGARAELHSDGRYRAFGTNTWTRTGLPDSKFTMTALTPGTSVSGATATHVGHGRYEAPMSLSSSPRLNTVDTLGKHFPRKVCYLPYPGGVDPATINPDMSIERQCQDLQRPEQATAEFSVWGVEADVTRVQPAPLVLDDAGAVARTAVVEHRILPAEYVALLAPTDVHLDVLKEGNPTALLSAVWADRQDFEIPTGLPLPPGDRHFARLEVRGVTGMTGLPTSPSNLYSPLFPLDSCQLVDLKTPKVVVSLVRDPLNETFCGNDGKLEFTLCRDSTVTLRVNGEIVDGAVDQSGTPVSLSGLTLGAGPHEFRLSGDILGLSTSARAPFTLHAVSLADASQQVEAPGILENTVFNRSVLPVGRTFVKGVDILDGHLVQQATDLKLPGRHLGLEVTRTYSSAGRSPAGAAGAGWALNYASRLLPAECGLVTVLTADGSSQVFRTPADGITFTPQKGYHTKLRRNADLSYDFIDKAGNLHHFREAEDPVRVEVERRLEYIEEPHKDRIVLSYDSASRVVKVAEVHPDNGEVRALTFTYVRKGGFERIATAETAALKLRIDYEYDALGNLTGVTRSGENLPGQPGTEPRVERYEYTAADPRDHHQMVASIDPNGNRVSYRYFARTDAFLGEDTGLLLDKKEEYVKEVRELPAPGQSLATAFQFDYREALSNRLWKTTVQDPRGNPTLYVLNGNGSPLEIREPLGKTTKMEWATDDIFKTKETDALGRITDFGYDVRGNLTSETIKTADESQTLAVTAYEYDQTFNKLTLKRDAEERETVYEIDPTSSDLVSMTDAVGNRTVYEYDRGESAGPGLLTSITDPRGHETAQDGHDTFGNARSISDALQNVTTREYDGRGRLLRQSDTVGHVLELDFDGLDRQTRARRIAGGDSDDEVTTTAYYPGGQTKRLTNPKGASTDYTLDGLNRVTVATTTGPGLDQPIATRVTYDGNSNKETETNRRGVKQKNSYDALNRLQTVEVLFGPTVEGPSGVVAGFGYDLVGNKRFETNVAGLQTDFEYDGLYRVNKKVLPESGVSGRYFEMYAYDKVGNRTSVTDANGHTTRFGYDSMNRLVRTENPLGHVATATYDDPEGSHVAKSEEHDQTRGLRTTFAYDPLNRERTRTVHLEGAGSAGEVYTTTTTYDDSAHAMTVRDPRGTDTRTLLDGLDRAIEQVVDPSDLNLVTRVAFDGLGNRKTVTDPLDRTTAFRHDALGRLLETTDALGHKTAFSYDGEGLKITETDRRQVTRTFTYDTLSRLRVASVLAVTSMSNLAWSEEIRYLDQARKRVTIDARAQETTQDLDGLDRVVKETDSQGQFRTFRWDGVNKREETDKRPQHYKTVFDYDELNRLTKVTDPLQQTVATAYEDAQNRTTETDKRGIQRVAQMDPLGRAVSVTRAVGTADEAVLETNAYDSNSNKTLQTDAEGRKTRFEYDPANRLKARTDGFETAEASATSFRYDKAGNQTEELDRRAADLGEPWSVKRTYDRLNRPETVTDGEGNVTTNGYDPEGNPASVQEPKGQFTRFAYDELAKLLSVTQPPADTEATEPVTAYRYDANRNRIRQTDANGHVVVMDYDTLNRLFRTTQDPAGLGLVTETTRFDANGNPEVMVDAKGQTITSTYDELNRLKTKAYAFAPGDPVRPWRHTTDLGYTYDANNNLRQVDESVASGTDPPGTPPQVLTTVRTYDNLDRLGSETTPLPDGGTRTVANTYYRNGTRKSVTDPAGMVTSYDYDGQNRLKATTTAFGTPTAATTTQAYWPDDLLKTVTYPNGVTATNGYDKADRLVSLLNAKGGSTVSSYVYGYDTNGNRLSQVEINGGTTETTGYTYDGLNRLASVTYPDKKVVYGYDAVGNRQRETEKHLADIVLSDKQGVFDAANRLATLTDLAKPEADPARTTSFTWDPNGNQQTKTVGTGPGAVTTEYRYDIRDKMVETTQGTSTLGRFQYDFEGRRTKKIGEEGLRQYVYDQTSLLAEYEEAGSQVAKYDYGSDRLISLFRRDEPRRYFSLDGLRTVVNLTDDGGSIAASYHLDAWGNFRFPAELTASKNRFGFTGYELDRETGLYNAKARYFDPQLGRFLSQDSYLGQIDSPPTLHRYYYAGNNSTRYIDPTGHAFTDAELREIGKQFNQRTAALQKDNRPDYEKGWWTNAGETFYFEFTGRMFSSGFKTYQGLRNMSQLGGEDPSLFIEGQVETVIAAAIPLIVKETAGALVSKIPVLGRDVLELGGKALDRAKVALEELTPRLPVEWSANPGANLGNLKPRRVAAPKLTPAEQLKVNEAAGAAFDAEVGEFLTTTADDVVPQVSIRPNTPEGPASFRFRPDYMTRERGTQEISPVEAKASSGAPLTARQKEGIPLLEEHGGTVVGKAGGEKYPAGTPVPPGTTTPVIRPDELAKKRK